MGGPHETQDAAGHARTGDTRAHDTDAAKSNARASNAGSCHAFTRHACARSSSASHPGAEAGMTRGSANVGGSSQSRGVGGDGSRKSRLLWHPAQRVHFFAAGFFS